MPESEYSGVTVSPDFQQVAPEILAVESAFENAVTAFEAANEDQLNPGYGEYLRVNGYEGEGDPSDQEVLGIIARGLSGPAQNLRSGEISGVPIHQQAPDVRLGFHAQSLSRTLEGLSADLGRRDQGVAEGRTSFGSGVASVRGGFSRCRSVLGSTGVTVSVEGSARPLSQVAVELSTQVEEGTGLTVGPAREIAQLRSKRASAFEDAERTVIRIVSDMSATGVSRDDVRPEVVKVWELARIAQDWLRERVAVSARQRDDVSAAAGSLARVSELVNPAMEGLTSAAKPVEERRRNEATQAGDVANAAEVPASAERIGALNQLMQRLDAMRQQFTRLVTDGPEIAGSGFPSNEMARIADSLSSSVVWEIPEGATTADCEARISMVSRVLHGFAEVTPSSSREANDRVVQGFGRLREQGRGSELKAGLDRAGDSIRGLINLLDSWFTEEPGSDRGALAREILTRVRDQGEATDEQLEQYITRLRVGILNNGFSAFASNLARKYSLR